MAGRWKPPKEDRTDTEAVRRKSRFLQDVGAILEYGTEEDFIAAAKKLKPDIGKQELRELIMQFRAYVREKRGLY